MTDSALNDDNIFTAARRLRNSIRADDAGGGFLSIDTVKANDHLAKTLDRMERQIKAVEAEGVRAHTAVVAGAKT